MRSFEIKAQQVVNDNTTTTKLVVLVTVADLAVMHGSVWLFMYYSQTKKVTEAATAFSESMLDTFPSIPFQYSSPEMRHFWMVLTIMKIPWTYVHQKVAKSL